MLIFAQLFFIGDKITCGLFITYPINASFTVGNIFVRPLCLLIVHQNEYPYFTALSLFSPLVNIHITVALDIPNCVDNLSKEHWILDSRNVVWLKYICMVINRIGWVFLYYQFHYRYLIQVEYCCTALITHCSKYSPHCITKVHSPRESYTWSTHASDSVVPVGISGRRQTPVGHNITT